MTVKYTILNPYQYYCVIRSFPELQNNATYSMYHRIGGYWIVKFEDDIPTEERHFERLKHAEFWLREIHNSPRELKLNEIDY